MSTSATAHKLNAQQKLILIDLFAALFCVLFGAVYELFSHGVYSYGMLYAFVFPLVLGVLPLLLLTMLRAPIATLTVGSIVSGTLEIYGTTNPLTLVYWIAGGALTVLGAAVYLISLSESRKQIAICGHERH